MSKHRRIGIILILIGLCIPLLLLAFATKAEDITIREALALRGGYPPQNDIVDKIQNLEIVLRKAVYVPNPDNRLPKEFQEVKSAISIPYKYVFATGVLCLFTGIAFLLLSSRTADTDIKR